MGQSWSDPITSHTKAIGTGLKEGAELPFTFIGDLADAVSGRNGGAGGFLDKYVPIRPAYRLYRAADRLRQQGCAQLADQYDAAADQLTQQILLVGIGGLTGWEKGAVDLVDPRLNIGNLRFRSAGGDTVNYLRGKLSYKTPDTPGLKGLVNPQGGETNCRACAFAVDKLLGDNAPSSAPGDLGRGADSAITDLVERRSTRVSYDPCAGHGPGPCSDIGRWARSQDGKT
ncbi:hypothetical protein [Streptomyces sp. NPDC056785]|uniref:hypothetical protein n=1 Tax=Streptomyces sp. NPDC056785 TaxID=3345944 RepID=UPI0036743FB8